MFDGNRMSLTVVWSAKKNPIPKMVMLIELPDRGMLMGVTIVTTKVSVGAGVGFEVGDGVGARTPGTRRTCGKESTREFHVGTELAEGGKGTKGTVGREGRGGGAEGEGGGSATRMQISRSEVVRAGRTGP